jgi:hypothetical protein
MKYTFYFIGGCVFYLFMSVVVEKIVRWKRGK